MKKKYYTILMEHPLGTSALRALLYAVGLPRTAEEEKIFADLAQVYEKMAPQTQVERFWTLFDLEELYLGTKTLTTAAKVMSKLFYGQAFLTLELAKSTHVSTPDKDRSKAFLDAAEDTSKFHQHCRELRLLTLQVAVKRIKAALIDCAGQK